MYTAYFVATFLLLELAKAAPWYKEDIQSRYDEDRLNARSNIKDSAYKKQFDSHGYSEPIMGGEFDAYGHHIHPYGHMAHHSMPMHGHMGHMDHMPHVPYIIHHHEHQFHAPDIDYWWPHHWPHHLPPPFPFHKKEDDKKKDKDKKKEKEKDKKKEKKTRRQRINH